MRRRYRGWRRFAGPLQEGGTKFPSSISTRIKENNVVWAKVTESGSFDKALVVFQHWSATARNSLLANYFSRQGVKVIEIAIPYHLERSRPGSLLADYMLSPNLGRTIQSMRQAVPDGRKLTVWLKSEGYEQLSVLGMSLGSWVAGIVAAHDTFVAKASLFLTAGSFAEFVWTGRATRQIPLSLGPAIELIDLRRAWGPFNLENYADRLARPDLDLQIVLARRDKVVLPVLSQHLVKVLKDFRCKVRHSRTQLRPLFYGNATLYLARRVELEALPKTRTLTYFKIACGVS